MKFATLAGDFRLDLAIFALAARHFPTIFAQVTRHSHLDSVIFAIVARQFQVVFMIFDLPLSELVIFGLVARNFCFDSFNFRANG